MAVDDSPRTVSASRVVMSEIVLPEDTNTWGNIFGGRVMALVDKCAAMSAIRHCRSGVLTASFDRVDFLHPIRLGEIILLEGRVNATFRTSMEVGVDVFAEAPLTGERRKTCRALVTLVSVDESGRPRAVPALQLGDKEEEERARRATERRRQRISVRSSP